MSDRQSQQLGSLDEPGMTGNAPPTSGFSTESTDSGVKLQVVGSGSDIASASLVTGAAGGKWACGC